MISSHFRFIYIIRPLIVHDSSQFMFARTCGSFSTFSQSHHISKTHLKSILGIRQRLCKSQAHHSRPTMYVSEVHQRIIDCSISMKRILSDSRKRLDFEFVDRRPWSYGCRGSIYAMRRNSHQRGERETIPMRKPTNERQVFQGFERCLYSSGTYQNFVNLFESRLIDQSWIQNLRSTASRA